MYKPPKSRMPLSGAREPGVYRHLAPLTRTEPCVRARSGPFRKRSHATSQHDLPAFSPLECYQIALWSRQSIDRLLSRLDRGPRCSRKPAAWCGAIQVLEWVRERLARTDELIRHPEKIQDARELAALLNNIAVLTRLAEEAMQVIKREEAELALAKQPPLLWRDQNLH